MIKKKPETNIMGAKTKNLDCFGAVVPPIFQNSLFTFPNWESIDRAFSCRTEGYIYSRIQNPTTATAEEMIADLAGGQKAKLFGSGMAAISASILHFIKPGDHILTINNIYGPANILLSNYLPNKMGITTTFISGEETSQFEKAINEKTKLIYLESPASATFSIQDIAGIAEIAKNKGIKTIIDNTWATPVFQKPLSLGIDLEVHSCSKYLGGHSDIVAGAIIGSENNILDISVNEGELLGGMMAPIEASLLIRSLRTLHIRLEKHQANSIQVAKFLDDHPKVTIVRYPGLKSFPQYELAKKQMSGYTGLMGFTLKSQDLNKIKSFFNALKIFQIGVSWGGHESLVYAPAISYLKELTPKQFKQMGISLGDMRISIGLEDAQDLIDDLDQALSKI